MTTQDRKRMRALRRTSRQAGATIAEFVVIMPIALLLVLGIIQLGLMFTAKQMLNQATFMAARAGAVQNARVNAMNDALTKALIPFYQDTTISNDYARLSRAWLAAKMDAQFVELEMLNPTAGAFRDFGITSNASGGHTYIPNDNLEFRSRTPGSRTGLTIQDANTLKIKVTYGYELKVPVMKTVMKAIMCGIDSGVEAFGRGNETAHADGNSCVRYYSNGRVPLVAYATVQMQTPAWRN